MGVERVERVVRTKYASQAERLGGGSKAFGKEIADGVKRVQDLGGCGECVDALCCDVAGLDSDQVLRSGQAIRHWHPTEVERAFEECPKLRSRLSRRRAGELDEGVLVGDDELGGELDEIVRRPPRDDVAGGEEREIIRLTHVQCWD